MTAGDATIANARPLIAANRRDLLRTLAPGAGLLFAWWLAAVTLTDLLNLTLVIYGLVQLALKLTLPQFQKVP